MFSILVVLLNTSLLFMGAVATAVHNLDRLESKHESQSIDCAAYIVWSTILLTTYIQQVDCTLMHSCLVTSRRYAPYMKIKHAPTHKKHNSACAGINLYTWIRKWKRAQREKEKVGERFNWEIYQKISIGDIWHTLGFNVRRLLKRQMVDSISKRK